MLPSPVKRVIADLKTLPRQFWVLAGGILVFLIGVEMTYPYETLYLNGRLGVSMTTIGVILGVALLATLPLQVAGGALCDKVGRRPILIVAILGSMTLYFGLGLTDDLAVIVALIAFEAAFGWAQFITASNAMIADVTTMEQRTEAFSVSRVALNVGIIIGPLLALPLLAVDPSYRLNFFASGIVCGVFLRDRARAPQGDPAGDGRGGLRRGGLPRLRRRPARPVACSRSASSPCCRSTRSARSGRRCRSCSPTSTT